MSWQQLSLEERRIEVIHVAVWSGAEAREAHGYVRHTLLL